jgi:hypothetical protein
MEVIFAGTFADKDYYRFRAAREVVQRENPHIRIECVNEYIPFEEISAFFRGADCVLVTYPVFEGSSGILGHSALHRRPVIGPAGGVIGRLIREYGLGRDIDPVDASNIASEMANFVKQGGADVDSTGMERYVTEREPIHFVRTLLEGEKGGISDITARV